MYKLIPIPITEKRPRKTETAKIPEDNFEEMEHEYPFGTFRTEKQC